MQYTMQACLHSGARPNPSSVHVRQLFASPVARGPPLSGQRRHVNNVDVRGTGKIVSGSRLSSRFAFQGMEAVKFMPQATGSPRGLGKIRVEASVGAYNKEAFVDDGEATKLAQVSLTSLNVRNQAKSLLKVAKRLERTAGYFKRLGNLGFWGQLVCTVVAAVILAFSVVITGQATSPVSIYLTAGGIAAAFLSVFWSFGYIRLSHRLRDTIDNPTKAPPRAQVVKNLKNGIVINLLGLGATLLGMQATVGVLVAKALTSSTTPYLQGAPAGYSPVLALDVFLVQASANALLSHFLGLVFSLELLRSITLSQPPPENVIPKPV